MELSDVIALGIGFGLVAGDAAFAQSHTESIQPSNDTFYRALDPMATFGAAGAMHVGGNTSVNGSAEERGDAASWMMFDVSAANAAFNLEFGDGEWELVEATLSIEEVGAPVSDLFAQGAGEFLVQWLENDDWTEGLGRPNTMVVGVDDNLSFDAAQARFNPAVDELLGSFDSLGADGFLELELATTVSFVADIEEGEDVTLALTASDETIGFTFHAKEWIMEEGRPRLQLTARRIGDNPPDDGNGGGPAPMCGVGMAGPIMLMMTLVFSVRLARIDRHLHRS